MRLDALLAESIEQLKKVGITTARLDARLLLCHALGITYERMIADGDCEVPLKERNKVRVLIARRADREPVSHILGRREFWGMDFIVTPDTLDPRPDSETLIEAALKIYNRKAPESIIDFGTGTGCLLVALLKEFPNAEGVGVDISMPTIKVARKNIEAHNLKKRAQIIRSNWGGDVSHSFDLIVSNPPYIPEVDIARLEPEVREHEPHLALVGMDADGLGCYREILSDVPRLLNAGGHIIFECGMGQAAMLKTMMQKAGLKEIQLWKDLSGIERCVSGHKT